MSGKLHIAKLKTPDIQDGKKDQKDRNVVLYLHTNSQYEEFID